MLADAADEAGFVQCGRLSCSRVLLVLPGTDPALCPESVSTVYRGISLKWRWLQRLIALSTGESQPLKGYLVWGIGTLAVHAVVDVHRRVANSG